MLAQKMFANFLSNFELLRTSNLRCKNAIFRTLTKYPSPLPVPSVQKMVDEGRRPHRYKRERVSKVEAGLLSVSQMNTIVMKKVEIFVQKYSFKKMSSFRQKNAGFFLASVPLSYCSTFPQVFRGCKIVRSRMSCLLAQWARRHTQLTSPVYFCEFWWLTDVECSNDECEKIWRYSSVEQFQTSHWPSPPPSSSLAAAARAARVSLDEAHSLPLPCTPTQVNSDAASSSHSLPF